MNRGPVPARGPGGAARQTARHGGANVLTPFPVPFDVRRTQRPGMSLQVVAIGNADIDGLCVNGERQSARNGFMRPVKDGRLFAPLAKGETQC